MPFKKAQASFPRQWRLQLSHEPSLLRPNPNPSNSPSSTASTPIPCPSVPSFAMAAAQGRQATPPPVIGKAGRYTVFITPPPTPKPSEAPRPLSPSPSPRNAAPLRVRMPPPSPSPAPAPAAPPVQVPPQQFEKPAARASGSVFGFFWDAVAKVQDAHSSLDEYLADWFGLNQSKYQWALNDYYENNGKMEAGKGGKPKELTGKGQAV